MNATYYYIPYKYTFPGTNIHWITFLFIVVEALIFFYQSIYWLYRPSDKSRFWYLVFVLLMLVYNTIGGLFVDIKIPISVNLQLYIEVFCGILVSMYFPYYIYHSLGIKKLKFFAVKGSLLFLFLPYIISFIILNELKGDIKVALATLVLIVIIYGYYYLYRLYGILLFSTIKDDTLERSYKIRFIGVTITASLWVGCLTCFIFLNLKQYEEHIVTNIGFLIMSYIFIQQSILESRKEHQKLLKSEKQLQNINELLIQKVRERTNELEHAIEQKTNTFISLAHEIRTPLTLVNNYLDEFIEKHGKSSELEIIRSNVEVLNNDVNTFFNEEKFNRVPSQDSHERILNFSDFLSDKIILFKSYALKKKIILTSQVEKNVTIKADPDKMHSIINNLIENAIKFTSDNGKIEVSLHANNDFVHLSVKDNGCGIPHDMQEKIFDPYFQVHRDNLHYQGIGMGLTIVKNFVKDLHGEIFLKSSENEGSEFVIKFRQHYLPENANVTENKRNPIKSSVSERVIEDAFVDNKRASVLIVEDNYEMLRYLREKLSKNYNIYVAENGKKALEKLKGIPPPNLFVTDVMMNEMNGFEFAKIISEHQNYKHIPLIFLTAKTTKTDKLQGLSLGAVDYIQKPFSTNELMKKIESIIGTVRKQQEAFLYSAMEFISNKMELTKKETDTKKEVFDINCKIYNITQREREIIICIADGLTYKEISNKLNLSEKTIVKHRQNIFRKIGVNSKVDLLKKLSE